MILIPQRVMPHSAVMRKIAERKLMEEISHQHFTMKWASISINILFREA